MKPITLDTKLKELADCGLFDISCIKPEYLEKTFRENGNLTWADIDPTGKFVASFNSLVAGNIDEAVRKIRKGIKTEQERMIKSGKKQYFYVIDGAILGHWFSKREKKEFEKNYHIVNL